MRRQPFVLAVVLALAIAGVLAAVLGQSRPRRSGTDNALLQVMAHLPPGKQACQPGQHLPAGTGAVLFFPRSSTQRDGPLLVTVTDASRRRTLARAAVPPNHYGPGVAGGLFPRFRRSVDGARVCVTNQGRTLVHLEGAIASGPSAELPANTTQVAAFIQLRFDYVDTSRRSWWSFAPAIADRFGLAKATFFGSWTMWAVLAALLALCLGTVLYAGRELSR